MIKGTTDISYGVCALFVFLYFIFASIIFVSYGLPSLRGEIDIQLYSDSITYEDAYHYRGGEFALISHGSNYLGPILVLNLFDANRYLVFIFNLFVIAVGIYIYVSHFKIKRFWFLIILATTPLIFFSLFGVNKEVFLLPISAFLICYIEERKFKFFVYALLLSFMVRWQMVAFTIIVFLVFSRFNFLATKRGYIILIIVGLLSLIYPSLANNEFSQVTNAAVFSTENEVRASSGTYSWFLSIQSNFGYFLVFIPKALQLLIGLLLRFDPSLMIEQFWNYFVIMMQCFHNLFLIILMIAKRKFSLKYNEFYLIMLYIAFFATTPIFGPRYLLPLSFWAALLLFRRTQTENNQS